MIYLFFNEDDKILWFYHMKYFNMIIGKICLIVLMFIKLMTAGFNILILDLYIIVL